MHSWIEGVNSIMSKSALDSAFEKFHKKKYKEAAKAFDKLLTDDDMPEWQKARLGQFKDLAERAADPPKADEDKTLKDVSYHMNCGNYKEAKALLKKLDLEEGGGDYLLAEIAVEEEDLKAAVDHLKKAITASKLNRGYALNSPSFATHLNKEEFAFLREESAEKSGGKK